MREQTSFPNYPQPPQYRSWMGGTVRRCRARARTGCGTVKTVPYGGTNVYDAVNTCPIGGKNRALALRSLRRLRATTVDTATIIAAVGNGLDRSETNGAPVQGKDAKTGRGTVKTVPYGGANFYDAVNTCPIGGKSRALALRSLRRLRATTVDTATIIAAVGNGLDRSETNGAPVLGKSPNGVRNGLDRSARWSEIRVATNTFSIK